MVCSVNAFVLEVTRWVTALMYLDGEAFFSCRMRVDWISVRISSPWIAPPLEMTFNMRICSFVMLGLAVVGVHHCSSHSATVSEQRVTCSWGL